LIPSAVQSKVSHNLPKLTASTLKAISIKAKHILSNAKRSNRLPLEEFNRAQIRGKLLTEVKSVFTLRLLRRGGDFILMGFFKTGTPVSFISSILPRQQSLEFTNPLEASGRPIMRLSRYCGAT
jgi:hypothetical protein